MTEKDTFLPPETTRRRFLGRLLGSGAMLLMMPLIGWFRRRPQRELSLSRADLYGPHDLAG